MIRGTQMTHVRIGDEVVLASTYVWFRNQRVVLGDHVKGWSAKRCAAARLQDPYYGWRSIIEPAPDNAPLRLLLRIGLVARRTDGSIRWPVHVAPWWLWRATIRHPGLHRLHKFFYVFRNRPGFIKWIDGRLLPRRWGFGILGLIEFGDRG